MFLNKKMGLLLAILWREGTNLFSSFFWGGGGGLCFMPYTCIIKHEAHFPTISTCCYIRTSPNGLNVQHLFIFRIKTHFYDLSRYLHDFKFLKY